MPPTEITIAQPQNEALSIEQLKWRQQQIHRLMDQVLKEGIDNDFAKIPGTQKLSLLKPGAEKICNLFQFVPTIARVEETRAGEDVTFRVTVALSWPTGVLLGEGIGSASTKESKFAWRKAVCPEEWEDAEHDQRRKKWFVDNNSREADIILQVRENPNDKVNNMLKIAKKRALIDAVLTVTGSSNLFTQDREDDIEGGGNGNGNGGGRPGPSQATAKKPAPADNGPIVEPKQAGRFYYIWAKDRNPPRTSDEVKLYMQRHCGGITDSKQMATKFYAEACRWAASNEPVPPAKDSAPAAAQAQPKQEEAKKAVSPEQAEADTAFGILGYDDKTKARFIEQYKSDWKVILGELKILVSKREDKF
jgi:hypothetical protein